MSILDKLRKAWDESRDEAATDATAADATAADAPAADATATDAAAADATATDATAADAPATDAAATDAAASDAAARGVRAGEGLLDAAASKAAELAARQAAKQALAAAKAALRAAGNEFLDDAEQMLDRAQDARAGRPDPHPSASKADDIESYIKDIAGDAEQIRKTRAERQAAAAEELARLKAELLGGDAAGAADTDPADGGSGPGAA